MASMTKMGVWKLVPKPAGVKLVTSKWVFKLKLDAQRRATRYKARLVARGFTQRSGIDYAETFAPVARLQTIRLLLALARKRKLHVHQMDVQTAFLNGVIDRDVYLAVAPEFETAETAGLCYKLHKAIYGLKQAGRLWNEALDHQLTTFGYKRCASEPCVYMRGEGDHQVFLVVYVDDLLLLCPLESDLAAAKAQLGAVFSMTDQGPVRHMLGLDVYYDREGGNLSLGQQGYIEGALTRFKYPPTHGAEKPGSEDLLNLGPRQSGVASPAEITDYAARLGTLLWVSQGTRPHIAFAVGRCARFSSNPDRQHFAAVDRIFATFREQRLRGCILATAMA